MKEAQRQAEKLGKSLKTSLLQEESNDNDWAKQAAAAQTLFDSQVAKAQQAFDKSLKSAHKESQKNADDKEKAQNDFMKEAQRQAEKLGKSLKTSLLQEEGNDNDWAKQAAAA